MHVPDRYSRQAPEVYNAKSEPLFDTDFSGILACSRPLVDKHQRYNAKSEPLFDTSRASSYKLVVTIHRIIIIFLLFQSGAEVL